MEDPCAFRLGCCQHIPDGATVSRLRGTLVSESRLVHGSCLRGIRKWPPVQSPWQSKQLSFVKCYTWEHNGWQMRCGEMTAWRQWPWLGAAANRNRYQTVQLITQFSGLMSSSCCVSYICGMFLGNFLKGLGSIAARFCLVWSNILFLHFLSNLLHSQAKRERILSEFIDRKMQREHKGDSFEAALVPEVRHCCGCLMNTVFSVSLCTWGTKGALANVGISHSALWSPALAEWWDSKGICLLCAVWPPFFLSLALIVLLLLMGQPGSTCAEM